MAKSKMGGKRRQASILELVFLVLLFTVSGQAQAGLRTEAREAASQSLATHTADHTGYHYPDRC